MLEAAIMSGIQASEKQEYTMQSTSEAKRVVGGYCIPRPAAIWAVIRNPPMTAPRGKLQICCRFCQVSASCHMNAMTPNSTADAPNTIGPYITLVIPKTYQNRGCKQW